MERKIIQGANPYLPLWEHIPDGEPRVFTFQGETRLYVYGSHDTEKTEYCGRDYVVWSAPVEDLTRWTYHGICYVPEDHSILYAPDVVQKGDTFYLYAAHQKGNQIYVAKSKTPWGPFGDAVLTELGFDPGILVDEDGRVYAYWGFCSSFCGELNPDMATLKEGTFHAHELGHCNNLWAGEEEHIDHQDAFFEASSPRKILGKYVWIYSKRYDHDVPELGVYEPCNGFLSYKWSDSPLTGYRFGGDFSFNGGEILPQKDGTGVMTYRWGNNHGSLVEVNGQWYVFYHRHTGTDEFARQGLMEPVDVAQGPDGAIYIGRITYNEQGEPVSSCPVEMTSQGPHIQGLDARAVISAGYACHIYGGSQPAYPVPVYEKQEDVSSPVTHLTDGVTVGFRYLQFGTMPPKTVTIKGKAEKPMTISLRMDRYNGREIARAQVLPGEYQVTAGITAGMIGKRAVYFAFASREDGLLGDFDRFWFD